MMDETIGATMATEVMRLLEVENDDLDNPIKFSQFDRVVKYFQGMSDWRYQMLKLIAGKGGMNNLKRMSDYVQLQQEKVARVQELDPSLFVEDIESEIENKYISVEGLARARKDISKRKAEHERLVARREEAKMHGYEIEEKETQTTEAGVEASKLFETEKTLNDIQAINDLLEDFN